MEPCLLTRHPLLNGCARLHVVVLLGNFVETLPLLRALRRLAPKR